MLYGDIFSKLHALPKGEKYSVQTPLGVASVRGSIFQVEHRDQTLVSNFDKSLVTFESFDEEFNISNTIQITQFLSISKSSITSTPTQPKRISLEKLALAEKINSLTNLNEIAASNTIGDANTGMVNQDINKNIFDITLESQREILPSQMTERLFQSPSPARPTNLNIPSPINTGRDPGDGDGDNHEAVADKVDIRQLTTLTSESIESSNSE